MGAKTEALARQFEGKAQDAVATLEKLGDGDWKKVTAAERWTVGVTVGMGRESRTAYGSRRVAAGTENSSRRKLGLRLPASSGEKGLTQNRRGT